MESQVKARDDQQATAGDFNNAQDFTRRSLDAIVKHGISEGRHFTEFTVTKKSALVVTIQAGRYFNAGGVYLYPQAQDVDLGNGRALATLRKTLITVRGTDQEVDEQLRDFLIDAQQDIWEAQSVSMEDARVAVIEPIHGGESADPQVPATPSTSIGIAVVTMDQNEILSVEMLTDNILPSVRGNHQRLQALEDWRQLVGPQISSISSDLAAFEERLGMLSPRAVVAQLAVDMGIVKERLEEPDDYVNYGADRYLTDDESDTGHGDYSARIQEGVRFPTAAVDSGALKLQNPSDPLVKTVNGVTLPAWTEARRLDLAAYAGDRSISQYQTQTTSLVQLSRQRRRIRFGETKSVCTNSSWWDRGTYDFESNVFTIGGETWEVLDAEALENHLRSGGSRNTRIRVQRFWEDIQEEPYFDRVTTTVMMDGKVIAQTWLNGQDGWLTSVDLKFTAIDTGNDVVVAVTEVLANGAPDVSRVLAQTTLSGGDANQFVPETGSGITNVPVTPTFLSSGKRYAILLITGGAYSVAMTIEGEATNGTFFYSTDGAFFMGDAANDMMFGLNYARFAASRVEVTLGWKTQNALELAGGIMDIDILAPNVMPGSTRLDYEIRPSAAWLPVGESAAAVLDGAPNLIPIRAVFLGTRDVMPSIDLAESVCEVSRPDVAFTHVSTERTLGSAATTVEVTLDLEEFDDTPHDCDVTILITGGAEETADVVADTVQGARAIQRKFTFNVASFSTGYRIKIAGATAAAADNFHVAQRTDYAV